MRGWIPSRVLSAGLERGPPPPILDYRARWQCHTQRSFDVVRAIQSGAPARRTPRRCAQWAKALRAVGSPGRADSAVGTARFGVLRPGGALDCRARWRFYTQRSLSVVRAIQSGAPHAALQGAARSRKSRSSGFRCGHSPLWSAPTRRSFRLPRALGISHAAFI